MIVVSRSKVKARREEEDEGTHRLMVGQARMEEEDQGTHRLMVELWFAMVVL